jgi:hypothetical protein
MSPLFTPVLDLVGVASGMKTVVIQLVGLVVTAIIYMSKSGHKRLPKELLSVIVIWLPFLAFAALQTRFSDQYAMVKFGKLVFIPFLSVLTITIAYMTGKGGFNRYFFTVLIILVSLQLIESIRNPAVFLYASTVERMTIEGVNPIWLSRSYVTAALCFLVFPIKSRWIKIAGVTVFMLAIIPTGTRGPLLGGFIGIGIYLWAKYRYTRGFKTKVTGLAVMAFFALLLSLPYIAPQLQGYFSRGTEQGLFEESGRMALFGKAIDDFVESPLTGVGFGMYARRASSDQGGIARGFYPHNIILEVMAELGMVGIILFIFVLRPGRYWYQINNIYQVIFIVYLFFSMTSGNLVANAGVMVFGALARLAYKYPHPSTQIRK